MEIPSLFIYRLAKALKQVRFKHLSVLRVMPLQETRARTLHCPSASPSPRGLNPMLVHYLASDPMSCYSGTCPNAKRFPSPGCPEGQSFAPSETEIAQDPAVPLLPCSLRGAVSRAAQVFLRCCCPPSAPGIFGYPWSFLASHSPKGGRDVSESLC